MYSLRLSYNDNHELEIGALSCYSYQTARRMSLEVILL